MFVFDAKTTERIKLFYKTTCNMLKETALDRQKLWPPSLTTQNSVWSEMKRSLVSYELSVSRKSNGGK